MDLGSVIVALLVLVVVPAMVAVCVASWRIRAAASGELQLGLWSKVWHLMRKNYLLKLRQWTALSCGFLPTGFICEFCLPFGIALLWGSLSHLAKINVVYTGWSADAHEVATFSASTDCPGGSLDCTPYSDDVATPAPFINTLIKLHWTQDMPVPVKIGLAVDDIDDMESLEQLQRNITDMWYPEGQHFKNIPCLPGATVFEHFGVMLTDPKNYDPDILNVICGKANHSDTNAFGVRPGVLSSFSQVTKTFTTDELDKYIRGPDYATGPDNPQLYAAVVFSKLPKGGLPGAKGEWDYTIRLNYTLFAMHGPHLDTESTTAKPITPGWLHGEISLKSQDTYLGNGVKNSDGGFMTLQMLIDRYIINEKIEPGASCKPPKADVPPPLKSKLPKCSMLTPEGVSLLVGRGGAPPTFLGNSLFSELTSKDCDWEKCKKNPTDCAKCLVPEPNPDAESPEVIEQLLKPLSYAPTAVQVMPMPIDGTVFNLFWGAAGALLPWCFILIFKYSEYLAISTFIAEKETRVREGLKMMGVTNAALIISWYLTYAVILFVMTFCLTLALKVTLMRLTSFVLLNMFFWLFTMSYIAFGYLIHTFFDKAMTGGIVGMIMSFAMFVVKVAAITPDTPYGQQMLLSLLAPTAFAQGIGLVATYEKNEKALDFASMHDNVENFTFASALFMLTFDIVLYTLLGAYFDEVLPKQFGIQQPLCFCFSKAYWKGGAVQDGVEDEETAVDYAEEDEPDIEDVAVELQQQEQTNHSVNIRKLRKVFSTPDGPKVAVHGLDLTIYRDQIFVLLGHNGAGKTTTMTMLTGLYMPSSGDATVQGKSIKTQMAEIRQRIGVCPQHDVLFAELTVIEHLQIFAGLKGLFGEAAEGEIQEKIAEVGLTEKAHVRSSNLSGGQKRKLSLAISLVGNSTAVFLDEPTSGMDPYSRRSTWNILQSNREGRVLILTTHFMDEADILGDRIGIMAEGRLKCCGSSLYLKNKYGAGYHLTIAKSASCDDDQLEASIRLHVPTAVVLSNVGTEISFQMPHDMAPKFAFMFQELDAKKTLLGIEQYSISLTTMEEVFMKIADGAHDDEDGGGRQDLEDFATKLRERRDAALAENVQNLDRSTGLQGGIQGGFTVAENRSDLHAPLMASAEHSDELGGGTVRKSKMGAAMLGCRHFRAMYLKRTHYARRDAKAVCCMTIMPCVLVFLGLALLKYSARAQDPPLFVMNLEQYPNADGMPLPVFVKDPGGVRDFSNQLKGNGGTLKVQNEHLDISNNSFGGNKTVYGVDYVAGVPVRKQRGHHKPGAGGSSNTTLPDFSGIPPIVIEPATVLAMSTTLLENGDGSLPADVTWGSLVIHNSSYLFGWTPDEGVETKGNTPYAYTLIQNTSSLHATVVYTNLANNAIKRHVDGDSSSKITVNSQPMPQTAAYHSAVQSSQAFTITFFTQVAFAFVPGAIVVFMVRERERHHNSKHQQVISGANIVSYWLGNFAFDMTMYSITMILTLLLFKVFDMDPFINHGAMLPMFCLFFGFGSCITAFTYCLSFLFDTHTRAQVLTVVLNLLPFGMILTILSSVLSFVSKDAADVNEFFQPFYRVFPLFCLPEALYTVTIQTLVSGFTHKGEIEVNYYSTEFCDMAPPPSAGSSGPSTTPQNNQLPCGIGKDLVMLYVLTPVYLTLTIAIDTLKNYPELYRRFIKDPVVEDKPFENDSDVLAEKDRVMRGEAETDVIVMKNLRKVYGPARSPKVAVKGVSLGIPKGECFGYLGINGAGKTSTLAMLTGDVLPSDGEAYLNGLDIMKNQDEVRRLLGYCPQHDALLERLTVREHLELFGRIKNVPEAALNKFVMGILQDMNLSQYENKLAGELSGGNKRKLSVGIAMIGKPPIIFMDEPSTGMDPVNKRFMWEVIARVCTSQKECSIILTTHSMEECEALCTRAGIMVGGRLRCLGSLTHLKAKFGDGYQVDLKLIQPSESDVADTTKRLRGVAPSGGLREGELQQACDTLGDGSRRAMITETDPAGCGLWHILNLNGSIPIVDFAAWWILQNLSCTLAEFVKANFRGSALIEQHDRNFRYKLRKDNSLGDVFGKFEESKAELGIQEYGVSETTLEQIFNQFAAQQEEETGPVRGMVSVLELAHGSKVCAGFPGPCCHYCI